MRLSLGAKLRHVGRGLIFRMLQMLHFFGVLDCNIINENETNETL